MNPARLLRQHLQSLSGAGLSHLPRVEVHDPAPMTVVTAAEASVATSPITSPKSSPKAEMAPAKTAQPRKNAEPNLMPTDPGAGTDLNKIGPPGSPSSPKSLDERRTGLTILADKVKGCTRCSELAETRKQTVFGVGNPQASILFIGEAPGADEDEQGEPFVGKAGQLLNQIITASRLKREELYICNILKCRPPGNRTPSETECANCREYLLGQLATIDPEYIVCWGAVAAQNLMSTTTSIGKMRGRFLQYGRAKVLCTYHPSYLLRNPAAKKDVWKDMQFLMADMGVDLTAKP